MPVCGVSQIEGSPHPISDNVQRFNDEYYFYELPDGFAINFNNKIIVYPSSKGLVALDDNCKELWRRDSIYYPVSMAKFGNNLLVILYKPTGKKKNDLACVIEGYLFDVTSGVVVSKRTLFTNTDNDLDITPKVNRDAEYNFQNLLLIERTTGKNVKTEYGLLTFDDQLNVKKQIVINTKLNDPSSNFFGFSSNNAGDLFLLSYRDNDFFCEKYNAGQTDPVATLHTALHLGKEAFSASIVKTNRANQDEVDVALRYRNDTKDYEIQSIRFDFAVAQSKGFEQKLDDDFGKTIGKKHTDYFHLIGLESYQDKIFVIQEFQWMNLTSRGTAVRTDYYVTDLLISVYDQNMHLIKQIPIEKYFYSVFPYCRFAGYKILGNRLILLANAGSNKFNAWHTEINLDNLSISSPQTLPLTFIEKDGLAIEGSATLWLNNIAYLQYYTSFYQKRDVVLQKVEF